MVQDFACACRFVQRPAASRPALHDNKAKQTVHLWFVCSNRADSIISWRFEVTACVMYCRQCAAALVASDLCACMGLWLSCSRTLQAVLLGAVNQAVQSRSQGLYCVCRRCSTASVGLRAREGEAAGAADCCAQMVGQGHATPHRQHLKHCCHDVESGCTGRNTR